MKPERRSEPRPTRGRIVGGVMMMGVIAASYAFGVPRANDPAEHVHPPHRWAARPHPPLPARIDVCETSMVRVCGTWTLRSGAVYNALWDDGATGTVRIREFDGTRILAGRVDEGGRLTAVYSAGISEGNTVGDGAVRWTTPAGARAGSWTATWNARLSPEDRAAIVRSGPVVPETGEDDFSRNTLRRYTGFSDDLRGSPWAIDDGALVGQGPAIQSVLVRKELSFADGWVETVSSRADDGGLVLRVRGNGDYYLLAFRDDRAPEPRGDRNLAVYHHIGSEYRELWYADVPWPRGSRHTIRFEAEGTRLRVWWDGEPRAELAVGQPRSRDRRPYTGPGGAGLRHYGDDPGWITRFDTFRWSPLR